MSVMSMNKERRENGLVICLWVSGLCFLPNIIPGSSTGLRSKPTRHELTPTFILSPTRQEEL